MNDNSYMFFTGFNMENYQLDQDYQVKTFTPDNTYSIVPYKERIINQILEQSNGVGIGVILTLLIILFTLKYIFDKLGIPELIGKVEEKNNEQLVKIKQLFDDHNKQSLEFDLRSEQKYNQLKQQILDVKKLLLKK